MENNKSPLYKDRKTIQHRNKQDYNKNLKDLADLVRGAEKDENGKRLLYKKLLGNDYEKLLKHDKKGLQKHEYSHDICNPPPPKKGRSTEKRTCRCMNYYGKDAQKCGNCKLKKKWNNVGKFKVTDYEVPMTYVISEAGGIDLLIDGKYATEVKPEKSRESLVRMIAEIFTYTIDRKYEPAICFFEDSKQMKDFKRLREEGNEDLNYLMKYVSVFYVSYTERKEDCEHTVCDYRIIPIEE